MTTKALQALQEEDDWLDDMLMMCMMIVAMTLAIQGPLRLGLPEGPTEGEE